MRFSCEGCSAKYMISDDKVGPSRREGALQEVRARDPRPARRAGGGARARRRAGRRVVGGHRRSARGTGGDRGAPAPLGPGRDRPGEPGLVRGARRVDAPLRRCPSCTPTWAAACRWRLPPPTPAPAPPPAPAPVPSPAPDDEWRPGAASALAALDDHQPRDVDSFAHGTRERSGRAAGGRASPVREPGHRDRSHRGRAPAHGRARADRGDSESPPRRGREATGPGSAPAPRESRSLTVVLLVALAVVAAVAVGLWWMTK